MNKFQSVSQELKEIAANMLSEQAKLADENAMFSAMLGMGFFYAVDAETNIILYVNENLKKLKGKDIVGHICYEELQDLCSVCDFCTNKIIAKKENEVYNWIHFNKNFMSIFHVSDLITTLKTNGRKTKVRFEQAFKITKEIKDQIDEAWKEMELLKISLKNSPKQ